MSKLTTKAVAKVAAVATGLGMATSLLSLAPMAHAAALTTDQVNSIISLLQSFGADAATIANVQTSLTGGTPTTPTTPSTSCVITMDLTVGSSGAQVTCLQQGLIAMGYSIPAGATGYFGSQTQAAVSAWQAAKGVSPAAGYFGPISRGVWSTTVVTPLPPPATTTPPTTLTGNGRFTDESSLGDVYSTLYAGDPATAVVGDSFVATDGDVQLQRVDATFDLSGVTTGSKNLNQYVSDVQLWLGDTKLATMDSGAGDNSSGVWTFRFSGLTAVVKKGDTAKLYVKVTPLSSVSANQDDNGSWAGTMTAKLLADSVRAISADGISDTYVASAVTNNFSISSATTATLTASPASSNPVAGSITVSSSTTSGVKLLAFNLKAKNSSVDINDLRISMTTSDSALSDVVNTVYLMKGSTIVKSASVSTGSNNVVTFSNLNEAIAKDATEEYQIVVDLKGNGSYGDGTTLIASTTVAGWDVSDSNGNTVSPSAAVAGNTQTLTGNGISAVFGPPTQTVNTASFAGGQDTANFTIPFTVTAGDSPVWIGGTATATTSTEGRTSTTFATQLGVVFATTTTSTATTTTVTKSVAASGTDALDASVTTTGGYYVAANSSRTFTLNINVGTTDKMSASTAVELGYQLVGINYSLSNTMGTTYYTSNLNTFKTPDVFIRGH